MDQMDLIEQLRKLEERVQQLEEIACLAKAKCKNCGGTLTILPMTKYVRCNCGELFGDTDVLLAESPDATPENLEWIDRSGYERVLLLSHLRKEISEKYPRLLAKTRI